MSDRETMVFLNTILAQIKDASAGTVLEVARDLPQYTTVAWHVRLIGEALLERAAALGVTPQLLAIFQGSEV